MSPVLSIILPVYNGEAFLERALESVLSQTLQNWELIVINDGSTDCSGAIVRRFLSVDTRIRYQEQENRGLSAARNAGFRLAKGAYIAFLDADDYVEPDYYQRLTESAVYYESDFFMAGFLRDFVKQGKKVHSVSVLFREEILASIQKKQVFSDNVSFYHLYIHVWNKLYQRNFLVRHGIFFDEALRYGEDVTYNLACLAAARSVTVLPLAGYHYVCHMNERITGDWKPGLLGENCRIYNEIDRFERTVWKLSESWVASGMFLRGCFLTLEKMMQTEKTSGDIRAEVQRILAADETYRSISRLKKRCASAEFAVYRMIVGMKRPGLFLFAVWVRQWVKRIMRR